VSVKLAAKRSDAPSIFFAQLGKRLSPGTIISVCGSNPVPSLALVNPCVSAAAASVALVPFFMAVFFNMQTAASPTVFSSLSPKTPFYLSIPNTYP
jgi:hypothetical protein